MLRRRRRRRLHINIQLKRHRLVCSLYGVMRVGTRAKNLRVPSGHGKKNKIQSKIKSGDASLRERSL